MRLRLKLARFNTGIQLHDLPATPASAPRRPCPQLQRSPWKRSQFRLTWRSARPYSHLARDTWPGCVPSPDGEPNLFSITNGVPAEALSQLGPRRGRAALKDLP